MLRWQCCCTNGASPQLSSNCPYNSEIIQAKKEGKWMEMVLAYGEGLCFWHRLRMEQNLHRKRDQKQRTRQDHGHKRQTFSIPTHFAMRTQSPLGHTAPCECVLLCSDPSLNFTAPNDESQTMWRPPSSVSDLSLIVMGGENKCKMFFFAPSINVFVLFYFHFLGTQKKHKNNNKTPPQTDSIQLNCIQNREGWFIPH